jgi:dienelactone hydrolase
MISALTLFLSSALATTPIITSSIEYGGGQFEGYLSQPKKITKSTPGILLVHNWMGISDETKQQADRYAKNGYIVFAVDVYGKNAMPKNQTEAAKIAGEFRNGDRTLFRTRLANGLEVLKKQKHVDSERLAALGYCFGGTGVIELARSGAKLKSFVSFHGGLDSPTPGDGKNISGRVLAHHGAIDPFVPPAALAAFENEMKVNKVNYRLIFYPGAVHSFTDKTAGSDISKGAAYNKTADLTSFEETKAHLKKVFSEGKRI